LITDVLAKRLVWFTEIEEIAMTAPIKNSQIRSAAAAVKAERALDKVAAMQEYEAEALALRANTERLRALRLAKEAESKQQQATKKAVEAVPDATMPEPTRTVAAKRMPAAKRASGKPSKKLP
jgi:hypothetical protein